MKERGSEPEPQHAAAPKDAAASGQTAGALAETLDFTVRPEDVSIYLWKDGFEAFPGWLGGEIYPNTYSDTNPQAPDDRQVFDDFPLVWDVAREGADEQTQLRAATGILHALSTAFDWPLVLVHNLALVVATYDPTRGAREFLLGSVTVDDLWIWT